MSPGHIGRWVSWPLSVVAIAVVLPLAMLFVLAWLSGWRIQTVETASMEPTVPAGSAVVVEPIDASEVRVGMPIAFRDESRGGQMVTHRVIEVIDRPAGVAFRTQGDANDSPDASLVAGRAIEGRMRWHIPYLGQMLGWLRWPWGFAALVATPLAVLLVGELAAWRRRRAAGSATPIFAAEARVTRSSAAAIPGISAREGRRGELVGTRCRMRSRVAGVLRSVLAPAWACGVADGVESSAPNTELPGSTPCGPRAIWTHFKGDTGELVMEESRGEGDHEDDRDAGTGCQSHERGPDHRGDHGRSRAG